MTYQKTMDILLQNKLSRAEWKSIEEPVSESEKPVLSLIKDGYLNINVRNNRTTTLFSVTKLEQNQENDNFLYKKYFKDDVQYIIEKYGNKYPEFAEFISQEIEIRGSYSHPELGRENQNTKTANIRIHFDRVLQEDM